MRRILLVAVVSLGLSFVPAALLAAGKPCGADVKNLVVEIFSRTSDPAYNIVGDAEGIFPNINTYTNINTKGNKINLLFQISNCSYDFTMNLSQSSRDIHVFLSSEQPTPMTASFFNFDRIGSVPVTNLSNLTAFALWCSGGVQTDSEGSIKLVGGYRQDAYAGCGQEPDPDNVGAMRHYAKRRAAFDLDNGDDLHFQSSPLEANYLVGPATGTSYIKVYHPSDKVWILEPEADPVLGAYSVLLRPANSGPPLFVSYQSMPFKMRITVP